MSIVVWMSRQESKNFETGLPFGDRSTQSEIVQNRVRSSKRTRGRHIPAVDVVAKLRAGGGVGPRAVFPLARQAEVDALTQGIGRRTLLEVSPKRMEACLAITRSSPHVLDGFKRELSVARGKGLTEVVECAL